LEFFSVAL